VQIIRYATVDGSVHCGVAVDGAVRRLAVPVLAALLRLPLAEARAAVEAGGPVEPDPVRLLPPVDGHTEVWAAGVTYLRSRAARREESAVADVYDLVYDADRPELFFKSVAWRVCGHGEPVGIRPDSGLDVPEAEVAVVVNAEGAVFGYAICDDVSSRSIEGANPLYLPQAKVYAGACALGPGIRPAWEVPDPDRLEITVTVRRGDAVAWRATTSTALLRRSFAEMVDWMRRAAAYPDGFILSTGTGAVPELAFTLRAGDHVIIEVPELGVLDNEVRLAHPTAFTWLADGPARTPR
jgi:2-dehydro-3-deoxy-D-arabinonate dehydratase